MDPYRSHDRHLSLRLFLFQNILLLLLQLHSAQTTFILSLPNQVKALWVYVPTAFMVIHVTISPMYSDLRTKPYLKQCGDQRQLCPATMVSQMPSREVHGSAMEEILLLFPWSTSGALQQLVSSPQNSYLHVQHPIALRLSTELLVFSQWPDSTTVAWTWRFVLPGEGRARCQLRTLSF